MNLTAAIIGPAHGLRGEVLLDIRTDDPHLVIPGASFDTDSSDLPMLTVVGLRQHKGRTLAIFDEILSREDAEAARGIALLTEEHEEDDAWYPHQLVGLAVQTPEGESLGEISGLQTGSAQDLLLVRYEGRTVMVPFVHQLVPVVDVEVGVVVIDAPAGLFDDDYVSTRD